jgi:hypothetical protein
LLPSGSRNVSFLVNRSTEQASWKRLLRGTGPNVPEARNLLHSLMDRLNTGQPFAGQLDIIINEAKDLEPWRDVIIRTPAAIEFCDNWAIRRNSTNQIYLLKKSQMNGTHAELFTYCLYHNQLDQLKKQNLLRPFTSVSYQSVIGTDSEPHIALIFKPEKPPVEFKIECRNGVFIILVELASLAELPAVQQLLCGSAGFAKGEAFLSKEYSSKDIEGGVCAIAKVLARSLP